LQRIPLRVGQSQRRSLKVTIGNSPDRSATLIGACEQPARAASAG
jgi:hypothetical protein